MNIHSSYYKMFDLAQPKLESVKAVFIDRPFTATIADAEEVIRIVNA